jgi:23S rRNA (uridine2552-2'-O)-methyltransferase
MTYRRRDAFHRRARAEGYRARSAYKLLELDRRYGLFRRGDAVVDLGAWPGGWLQVALERVGPGGRVAGVDVARIEPLTAPNVSLVQGDVREPATVERIRESLGRPADVVLSDLAPKLSGVKATDQARTSELHARTVAVLPAVLRPGGRLLMKVFMDPGHETLLASLRPRFAELRTTRPQATPRGSAELYVVGLGHRPGAPGKAEGG